MDRREFLMDTARAMTGAATALWPLCAASGNPGRTTDAQTSRRKPSATPANGPLRVHPSNPRYFTDGSGRAVYLTGAHTWSDMQDMGAADPPKPFDFTAYLDFLQTHHHNFIRLWRWEQPEWKDESGKTRYCAPHPWQRTGPGLAQDGKPKFDLTRFDPAYFRRLRRRVSAARDRGIYVSLMLFEGWGMQFASGGWQYHPFHPDNNINHVRGDKNGDGKGLEIYTLADPALTALQEAYVRKVIDTVNDLDNALYEISNENHPPSTEWQYHMIRYIKQHEAKKRKQHPVGMTFQYQGGSNATLFQSPADWISPNPEGGYREDPPPADGRKVVLLDTDHLWGEGGDHRWVWKSFLRGHNPLYMDRIAEITGSPAGDIPGAESVRQAMGNTRLLAERMTLAAMTPRGDLASTGYCLANPGAEYLVYLPEGRAVSVDLSDTSGSFSVEWTDPVAGAVTSGDAVAGGERRSFTAPFEGGAALHLRRM
jgi:hypothetical protein